MHTMHFNHSHPQLHLLGICPTPLVPPTPCPSFLLNKPLSLICSTHVLMSLKPSPIVWRAIVPQLEVGSHEPLSIHAGIQVGVAGAALTS